MDTSKYYFSNLIEDDDLSIIAVKAKQMMQQMDHIMNLFKINNEIIYGHSPRQALFLMQQNNKSIFSPSSSKESSPSSVKSSEEIKTPTKHNPGTSNMRRRCLPLDDTEKKDHPSTSEFSTPILSRKPTVQSVVEVILNPDFDKFRTRDEQLASKVGSAVEVILNPNFDKFRTRDEDLAIKVSPGPGSQQSSPTTEISRMTANLAVTEKEFGSPAKVDSSIDASYQKSRPSVIVQAPLSLAMAEKKFGSPGKEVCNIKPENQESLQSLITWNTSSPTVDDKHSKNLIRDNKMAGYSANNLESTRSAQISMTKESLVMAVKEFFSRETMVRSNDANSLESTCSAQISPAKEVGNIKVGNQESPRSTEITRLTSNLAVDDKDSRNLFGEEKIAGDSAINKDFSNPEENTSKSRNAYLIKKYEEGKKASEPVLSLLRKLLLERHPSKKHFITHSDEIETSEPVLIRSETPSPNKRSKICSIPTFDTQWFTIPAKNNKVEHSPKDSEAIVSRMLDAKPNTSPIETMSDIRRDDRKRKTLSPIKRGRTLFKSIPKVINLDCEEEMGVEVLDLEYGASPTTSRSKSADYRSNSPKDSSIKSLVQGDSKTDSSPKTPERNFGPSDRAIANGSSRNVSLTSSPGSDDDAFTRKNPSGSPSIVSRDASGKLEYTAADIEANPMLLKATVLKFTTLLDIRDTSSRNSFGNFENFQSSINFISICVNNIMHLIMKINASGKYSTEEFKEIVSNASVISAKILNKMRSWKKEVDFDIDTFQKCFQKMEQLKEEYAPLFTNENEPAVIFAVVQVYESEMKAIWKKIDDMVMLGDSRRPLFAHLAHDVERLIKMLVKSLILVGILQAR